MMTVKELIEKLEKCDQDAVICSLEMNGVDVVFSSFEMCEQYDNVEFFNDSGYSQVGNIVAIY